MDDELCITLEIPDPDDFAEDRPHVSMPVPDNVVDSGIQLLQCMLAQWKQEREREPDQELWGRLAASAAQMLSGLIGAWTAYYDQGGAHALVDQIAWFCHWDEVPERLEGLRGPQAQAHPAFRTYLDDAGRRRGPALPARAEHAPAQGAHGTQAAADPIAGEAGHRRPARRGVGFLSGPSSARSGLIWPAPPNARHARRGTRKRSGAPPGMSVTMP